jgi:transcriptional regulator with XRE-family HTH domain
MIAKINKAIPPMTTFPTIFGSQPFQSSVISCHLLPVTPLSIFYQFFAPGSKYQKTHLFFITGKFDIVNSLTTPFIGLAYRSEMSRLRFTLAKRVDTEEQALRDILSLNVKKYRNRRAWSQFTLAAKIDMSTNFLADLEAGNTWVSALTLVKLAKAFEIEVYELLKPDLDGSSPANTEENEASKALMDRFSKDLAVVLKDSVDKALEHVKKHYTK